MKLTKTKLKQLIKEELATVLKEKRPLQVRAERDDPDSPRDRFGSLGRHKATVDADELRHWRGLDAALRRELLQLMQQDLPKAQKMVANARNMAAKRNWKTELKRVVDKIKEIRKKLEFGDIWGGQDDHIVATRDKTPLDLSRGWWSKDSGPAKLPPLGSKADERQSVAPGQARGTWWAYYRELPQLKQQLVRAKAGVTQARNMATKRNWKAEVEKITSRIKEVQHQLGKLRHVSKTAYEEEEL